MEGKVNGMDALTERVSTIDTNLSAHSSTLTSLNSTMDSRLAAVDSRVAVLESRASRQSSSASTQRLRATTSHSRDSIPQSSPSPRSTSSATPPMMSSGASSAQTPVRVPRQGSASDQTTLPRNTLSPSPSTASSAAAAVVAASPPRKVGLLLKGLLLQVQVYATVYIKFLLQSVALHDWVYSGTCMTSSCIS